MKKSQAAMESLMTYGWAVLLVAVALLGLQFFGVFDFQNRLPKQCTITQGISCLDFEVDTSADNFQILLKNSMGAPIENVKFSVPGCLGWHYPGVIPSGDKFKITILNCPVTPGRLKINPLFSYEIKDVGLIHVTNAEITNSVGDGKGQAVITNVYLNGGDCPPPPNPGTLTCRDGFNSVENGACFYDLPAPCVACFSCAGSCDKYGNCV